MTQLSRWRPTSGRAKLAGLLATGLLVVGCGGEEDAGAGSGSKDDALTKAAQWATGQSLRAELDGEDGEDGEIVVMRHGTPRYTATKITQSPDGMTAVATLTGEIHAGGEHAQRRRQHAPDHRDRGHDRAGVRG